jgi:hypothetical protein
VSEWVGGGGGGGVGGGFCAILTSMYQCFERSLLQRIDMSSCRDQDIWVHGWLEMVVNNEFAHFDTYNTSANI